MTDTATETAIAAQVHCRWCGSPVRELAPGDKYPDGEPYPEGATWVHVDPPQLGCADGSANEAAPQIDHDDAQPSDEDLASEAGQARLQGRVLREMAKWSPIRQVRYELGWRGSEWLRAADDLDSHGDDATIEMLTAVVPGMKVPSYSEDDDTWIRVARTTPTGLMVEVHKGPVMVAQWRNFQGPSSPVVVRR